MAHAIYEGMVTHVRLRPVRHKLRYRVFTLLLDCNDLPGAARHTRLFSLNRFNLVSFYEKDHGDGEGDLRAYLAKIARDAGLAEKVHRFEILAYPRILGYAFNPLTTYYGYDDQGEIALMVYEVRNTFGQRITYVIPAKGGCSPLEQSCDKALYVSPFNHVEGNYSFRVLAPAQTLSLAITLTVKGETVLTAAYAGERHNLTGGALIAALGRTGWMTLKVVAGIYLEAVKLWLKGLRLKPRPPAPKSRIVFAAKKADVTQNSAPTDNTGPDGQAK